MHRCPQVFEFLERAKNDEEECSNRNQEHEVKQQHGVTSEPVVVAGDLDSISSSQGKFAVTAVTAVNSRFPFPISRTGNLPSASRLPRRMIYNDRYFLST